jgi:phage baseplate assembly protein W
VAVIEFKSVGTKIGDALPVSGSLPPIGIKTPLRFGTEGLGIFAMHSSLENQLADNLRNLLLTNHGERMGLYDFGANLRPLTAEFEAEEDFDSNAILRIKEAAARYMPFIALKTFESSFDTFNNQHTAKIIIKVTYDIPTINVIGKQIKVTLHVM